MRSIALLVVPPGTPFRWLVLIARALHFVPGSGTTSRKSHAGRALRAVLRGSNFRSVVLVVLLAPACSRGASETRSIDSALDSQAGSEASQAPSSAEPPLAPVGSARPCPAEIPAGMSCVLGGSFVRGSDDGPPEERGASEVFVSTFFMDTHEVSNARYAECVSAGVCRRAMPFPGYMQAAQPALAMRWADADAYCRWRDRRLPTEAEWERAASGPDDTRYPWGDTVDDACARAIVRVRQGRGCGTEVTWPVGSRPPGPFGLHDMAGNAWEWVADHHSRCYRGCGRECGGACEGDDPRGLCGDPHAPCPEARGQRTVRGGSWWYGIERATVTARRGVPADNPNPHRFGFRCARDLGE